jgi:Aspartyl protease/PDZ domain
MQPHNRLIDGMILVFAIPCLLLGEASGADRVDVHDVRESFKFDPDDYIVLVPVRLGSKDYQFILDTGATRSVFDTVFRARMGPHVRTEISGTPRGETKVELYSPPDAQLGCLPLSKSPAICCDLAPFRESSGYDVRGFLGMDFLKDWIVCFDFDDGRVDFLSPKTPRSSSWGDPIGFNYDATGLVRVSARLGKNDETLFLIDTGMWGRGSGDLEESLFSRLVDSGVARATGTAWATTIVGQSASRAARLSQFSLHSFRHENLRFTSGKANSLGLHYLSRFRVTFDFPNKLIYLAKGKHFADRDYGSLTGIHSLFKPNGLEVQAVEEKRPGSLAGVRPKDVIVELNGTAISKFKPSEIRRLFATEGKTVRMTVERGGKRMEMSFIPREFE